MAWLKQLELPQRSYVLKRDLLVDEIEHLTAQARGNPAVARLRTIPSVGPRTAEAVVAFLDDPQRFGNAKEVGAYFGLVPCQDQSGAVNRLRHITRQQSTRTSKQTNFVTNRVSFQHVTLSSRAGIRRTSRGCHGASRCRACEWESPYLAFWRAAQTDDAEWMVGHSRTQLAPGLDKDFLMDGTLRPALSGALAYFACASTLEHGTLLRDVAMPPKSSSGHVTQFVARYDPDGVP